jgi:hypothetical protein
MVFHDKLTALVLRLSDEIATDWIVRAKIISGFGDSIHQAVMLHESPDWGLEGTFMVD